MVIGTSCSEEFHFVVFHKNVEVTPAHPAHPAQGRRVFTCQPVPSHKPKLTVTSFEKLLNQRTNNADLYPLKAQSLETSVAESITARYNTHSQRSIHIQMRSPMYDQMCFQTSPSTAAWRMHALYHSTRSEFAAV
jgi:hypothetical protein